MLSSRLLSIVFLLIPSPICGASSGSITTVLTTLTETPSTADFISSPSSLDAPKLHPVNATTPAWWYFDVAAPDLKSHIVITFFTATNDSFPLSSTPGVDSIYIWATFPNGTAWEAQVPATKAVIKTKGDGVSGVWDGTGFSFDGAPDLSRYVISIDSKVTGVKGVVKMNSVSPPHYPCGPLKKGQNMSIAPGIGWSNAIPDASATVDLNIEGVPLKFTGVGYHDQNWATAPILSLFQSWYWGHFHLGPFSLVYFSVIDLAAVTHVSAYIAKNGKILTTQCASATVRPYGANDAYPPQAGGGDPIGFAIQVDIGNGNGTEVFVATTKLEKTLVEVEGIYSRWLSSLSGGVKGGKRWNGVGINEQFTLAD